MKITLSHGSGGKAMSKLIDEIFLSAFDNRWLALKADNARIDVPPNHRLVVSTDSHVISPIFFPGGDIGSLSVNGTVNDVSMAGAKPLYLTAGFILEEGFPISELRKIAASMANAAEKAGVAVIAGDTKVVEKGKGDGIYITTAGIGIVPNHINIAENRAKPGDAVLLSGTIGDHGIAVLSARENLKFKTAVVSDSVALNDLVTKMVNAVPNIHCLRDPTRGGLAAVLNEWADSFGIGFLINEEKIPVRTEVSGACELLGFDPLYIANEGKLVAVCAAEDAEKLLNVMKTHSLGKNAAIIGNVTLDSRRFVQMRTPFGGIRVIDWLVGDQLPRIC